jgi:hypothetical protein
MTWVERELADGQPYVARAWSPSRGNFEISIAATSRIRAAIVAQESLKGTDALVTSIKD